MNAFAIKTSDRNPAPARPVDIDAIHRINNEIGFRCADPVELSGGLALAERLIGQKFAGSESIRALHAHSTIAVWVIGDPIEGMHIMCPLTPAGEAAVRSGQFVPASPGLSYCCTPGDMCAGIYVGAYAGETRDARRAIMRGAAYIRFAVFGTVPCFARAATEDGARSMLSLGFAPVDPDNPNSLWVQEALTAGEAAT